MGNADYFRNGDWNAICDQCSRKFKASQLVRDGQTRGALRVCLTCYDPLHPQELMRPVADPKPIPWSRPDSPPVFIQDVQVSFRAIDSNVIGSTTLG
jgi:hypothetical protein